MGASDPASTEQNVLDIGLSVKAFARLCGGTCTLLLPGPFDISVPNVVVFQHDLDSSMNCWEHPVSYITLTEWNHVRE